MKFNKLPKEKEKIAIKMMEKYRDIARFGAVYTLSELEKETELDKKVTLMMSSMMSLACVVLEKEMKKNGKKQK